MIEIRNLSQRFAGPRGWVEALHNVNLTIPAGEVFGIIGRSGAGKSTLVRTINLLTRPSEGSVIVDGRDLTTLPAPELRAARRDIGMIFQHFNLLSSRTVFDNVALPLELAGMKRAEIEATVLPLLDLVGLTTQKDRYPAQISGGQKQRVGIARALASKPKVLLSDEATSALDPETTRAILDLLRQINRELGLTVVLITHQMDVIKQVCDRVAVLDAGRVVEEGNVDRRVHAATSRSHARADRRCDRARTAARDENSASQSGSRPAAATCCGSRSPARASISRFCRRRSAATNSISTSCTARSTRSRARRSARSRCSRAGEPVKVAEAIAFLRGQGVVVEELSYVE